MRSRYFFIRQIVLAFFLCMASGLYAQTTAFTYQGKLTDTGSSATGTYLMEFRLFDAVSSGTQVGSTILNPGVSVTNGIFTVQLDFRSPTPCPTCFNGADRYLEVSVKKNAGDAFTILSPRQQITSAPYAIRSANASLADNASLLGGQPPSAFGTSAQIATLQAQNASLQAQITQLQSDLASNLSGTQLWAKGFGSTNTDAGISVAVDSVGNVFVTGSFYGTVDFGGGPLVSASGSRDIFLAKYSGATGAHMWSKRLGGTFGDDADGVAVDGSGNVFVTGGFQDTVNFGGGALISAGGFDVFLAKYSGATGAHLWSKRFGGIGDDEAFDVAVDTSGNVIMAGFFYGTVDFGGLPLTSVGSKDVFAAKYSGTTSAQLWSKGFGGTSDDYSEGVATDGSGNVFLTGFYNSPTINFGGGALANAGGAADTGDGFIVKLASADGTHLWSKRFGGINADIGLSVATDSSGSVFATGYFNSTTINFGGGTLTNAGGPDIFVAKYNASGTHQWSKAQGGTDADIASSVAVDNGGNVIVTGSFASTTINFGGTSMNNAGGADIFVVKYAGVDGAHQWSRRFGSTADFAIDEGDSIAIDSSGNIFLTGYFSSGNLDFGGGPLANAGATGTDDIFIAKLNK